MTAPRAVFEASLPNQSCWSVPSFSVSLPPRLAAQYFFIRSPTALRWAADMVLRRRRSESGELIATSHRIVSVSPRTVLPKLGEGASDGLYFQ